MRSRTTKLANIIQYTCDSHWSHSTPPKFNTPKTYWKHQHSHKGWRGAFAESRSTAFMLIIHLTRPHGWSVCRVHCRTDRTSYWSFLWNRLVNLFIMCIASYFCCEYLKLQFLHWNRMHSILCPLVISSPVKGNLYHPQYNPIMLFALIKNEPMYPFAQLRTIDVFRH